MAATSSKEKRLIYCVRHGMLFEVQRLFESGTPIPRRESNPWNSVLTEAVSTNFHSMVEWLLINGAWTDEEKRFALSELLWRREGDREIIALLLKHGAPVHRLPVACLFDAGRVDLLPRFLRGKGNVAVDNGFARSLLKHPKEGLKIYRRYRSRFREMELQASLAMDQALQEGKDEFAVALAQAGASTKMKVPWNLDGHWDGFLQMPLETAAHLGKLEFFHASKVTIDNSLLCRLLACAAHAPNCAKIVRYLLARKRSSINDKAGRCDALDSLLTAENFSSIPPANSERSRQEALNALLRSDGQWKPTPYSMRRSRRALRSWSPDHCASMIRILLRDDIHRPLAVELCNPNLLSHLDQTPKLLSEIREALRPKSRI